MMKIKHNVCAINFNQSDAEQMHSEFGYDDPTSIHSINGPVARAVNGDYFPSAEMLAKYAECTIKVDKYTYMQQYITKEGRTIYFYMDRIDDRAPLGKEKQEFWKTFVYKDGEELGPNAAGNDAIRIIFLRAYMKHAQAWICFATTKKYEAPVSANVPYSDIVMYMSYFTRADFPVLACISAQRSAAFSGIQRRGTGGISLPILSFSARVILLLYPDKPYFMINAVPTFANIISAGYRQVSSSFISARRDFSDPTFPWKEVKGIEDTREYKSAMQKTLMYKAMIEKTKESVVDFLWDGFYDPIAYEFKQIPDISDIMQDTEITIIDGFNKRISNLDREMKKLKVFGTGLAVTPVTIKEAVIFIYDKGRNNVIMRFDPNVPSILIRNADGTERVPEEHTGQEYMWFFNNTQFSVRGDALIIDLIVMAEKYLPECPPKHIAYGKGEEESFQRKRKAARIGRKISQLADEIKIVTLEDREKTHTDYRSMYL